MGFASAKDCAEAVVRVCRQKDVPALDVGDIEGEVRFHATSVLLRHHWLFLVRLTSTVTEANENTYTLSGASDDCVKVLDLKYNGIPIGYRDWSIYQNVVRTPAAATTTPKIWTVKSYTDTGFPQIEIYGTPAIAGIAIEYRYKIKVDGSAPETLLKEELWDWVYYTLLSIHYPWPRKADGYRQAADQALAAAKEAWLPMPIDLIQGSDTLADRVKEENFEINMLASDRDLY